MRKVNGYDGYNCGYDVGEWNEDDESERTTLREVIVVFFIIAAIVILESIGFLGGCIDSATSLSRKKT